MVEIPPTFFVSWLANVAVILGLAIRGRWRLSLFFLLFTVTDLASGVLPYLWPRQFYTQAFWMLMTALLDVLRIAIALEILWRTFREFPGAASVTRQAVVTLLALTALAALTSPLSNSSASSFETAAKDFYPRVMDGAIWLFAATLALSWFYRVPLHPFHRAVLTSLAMYTAFLGLLLRLCDRYEFMAYRPYMNALNGFACMLVYSWWAYLACRPTPAADLAYVQTMQRLRIGTASLGQGAGV